MMKLALASFVGVAALVVCGSASAQLKYNYAEVGYQFTDIDSVGDGNGITAGLSFSPIQNVFLYANGAWSSVDFSEIQDDFDEEGDLFSGELGVGVYLPLSNNLDIVGRAGWAFDSYDFGDIRDDIDSNSVEFELGLRTLVGQQIELGAFVGYSDLESIGDDDDDDEDDNSGVAVDIYGIYHLSHAVGIGVSTTLQDSATGFTAFLRYHF